MSDLQRTPEWYAARLGKWTGSRVGDATAKTKTGWSTSRNNYMTELLLERITGQPTISYVSKPMQDGIDREPDAITNYEFARNVDVVLVGFVPHPTIENSGCSPDGLVGADGMVQFKCPLPATHLETLLGVGIDGRYIKQVQWEMACHPGRKWCDWVSYCPLFPPHIQLVIRRVERDDKAIADLEKQCREFLAELDEKHRRVLALGNGEDETTLRQLQASVEAIHAQ